MPDREKHEVTRLLRAWADGDSEVEEKLWPLVYDQLRAMARRYLDRERADHTLQATALVHEAYLKMVDQRHARFEHRRHFFAIAATMMRRVLVDYARQRASAKRGSASGKLPLEQAAEVTLAALPVMAAVDEALVALEKLDPYKAKIVELRFFAGLTNHEVGELLGTSEKTIRRHWQVAKGWLRRELRETANGP